MLRRASDVEDPSAGLLSENRRHEDQRARLCTELAMLDSLTMTRFAPWPSNKSCAAISRIGPRSRSPSSADATDPSEAAPEPHSGVARGAGGEKVYHFQGKIAVGKLFNGLVNIERSGVPNGI